ncbi:HET-domain-containing protein [Ophiobolus disseminans]|uniref:HET-domain-containing protein n=1 Tax=Ophiobolus disseminans TaxID=1469910 RepID=A0A6A7A6M0_9PLEO|nr:HET-domain-containing protein [Ophiobolus disseminans]
MATSDQISGYTDSEQARVKARSWLANCVTKHNCPVSTIGALPTRVVQINGHKQVRLHISNGERASYACLSHCWRDNPRFVLRTTTETLQHFQAGIPWGWPPRTFRDAIEFTQTLGLKYLWIDSLCIIQDFVNDWRHEGNRMADIYESALLTLAASKASNPTEGCFSVSANEHRSRFTTIEVEAGDCATFHTRTGLAHREGLKDNCPLLRRGWVRNLKPKCRPFANNHLCEM